MTLSRVVHLCALLFISFVTSEQLAGGQSLPGEDAPKLDGLYNLEWNIEFSGTYNETSTYSGKGDYNGSLYTSSSTTVLSGETAGKLSGSAVVRIVGDANEMLSDSNVYDWEMQRGTSDETHSYELGEWPSYHGWKPCNGSSHSDIYFDVHSPSVYFRNDAQTLFDLRPEIAADGTVSLSNLLSPAYPADGSKTPKIYQWFEGSGSYTECGATTPIPSSFRHSLRTLYAHTPAAAAVLKAVKLVASDATNTAFVQDWRFTNNPLGSENNRYTGRIYVSLVKQSANRPPSLMSDKGAEFTADAGVPIRIELLAQDEDGDLPSGAITATSSVQTPVPVFTYDPPSCGAGPGCSTMRLVYEWTPTPGLLTPYVNDVKFVARDRSGATSTLVIHINVNDRPKANFTFIVHPGGRIVFDATGSTSSTGIDTYVWTYGDEPPAPVVTARTEHSFDFIKVRPPLKKPSVSLVVVDSKGRRSDRVARELDLCAPDTNAANAHEYAGVVRCVEEALPGATPRQVLSLMRQMYYGAEPWSRRYEPRWLDLVPCGENFAGFNPKAVFNPKLTAAVFSIGATDMPEGDMSHVFPALEVMECPSKKTTFTHLPLELANLVGASFTVDQPNYEIATWGGDVASAAGLKVFHDTSVNPFRPPSMPWENYIGPQGIRAGYDDLSADLDGMVMSYSTDSRACTLPPGPGTWSRPVSHVLVDYYPDPTDLFKPVSTYYAQRVSCYLNILQPGGQLLRLPEAQFTARIAARILEVSRLYYLTQVSTEPWWLLLGEGPRELWSVTKVKEGAEEAARRFGLWLRSQN